MVLDEFDRMVTPGAYPELSQLCKVRRGTTKNKSDVVHHTLVHSCII